MSKYKFRAWDKSKKVMLSWELIKALITEDVKETNIMEHEFIVYDKYIQCVDLLTGASYKKGIGDGNVEISKEYSTNILYKRGFNIWDDYNFIFMQYSSLKEIYEGDILSSFKDDHGDEIVNSVVRFGDYEFEDISAYGFYLEYKANRGRLDAYPLYFADYYGLSVIGNIFKNPDMIRR
jgi:hypothetical protein